MDGWVDGLMDGWVDMLIIDMSLHLAGIIKINL